MINHKQLLIIKQPNMRLLIKLPSIINEGSTGNENYNLFKGYDASRRRDYRLLRGSLYLLLDSY